MPRRAPGSTSGSGDTVEANCPTDPSGNDWQGATAELMVRQVGGGSTVDIDVKNAVPNTVFTVWMRMARAVPGSMTIGSPMTGGGATPLAAGNCLDGAASTTASGSSRQAAPIRPTASPRMPMAQVTSVSIWISRSLVAPIHSRRQATPLAGLINAEAWLQNVPTPIVNPADRNIGGPFLLRVISHCTDQQGHGLSPGVREAWFQYP